MPGPNVLVVNPGSTSTKVAIFSGPDLVTAETIHHDVERLALYPTIMDQFEPRYEAVMRFLDSSSTLALSIAAVVGRGGLLPPMEGGVYVVDDAMCTALREHGEGHASSLGGLIARAVADPLDVPSFIADPVTTDELEPLARYTGLPEVRRRSIFHALNQKAVGRKAASDLGMDYGDCNLIIAHLGGGISIGAHRRGRVVDSANALDGEGPYSPERSGSLPSGALVHLCYSGKYSEAEMRRMIVGQGGLAAYLGTNSLFDVEKQISEGNDYARLCYEGMAYQTAKEIGRITCVLSGNVDAIVLTGGAANSRMLTDWITERVEFIARVLVYPGESEMEALADAAIRVLSGVEEAKHMPSEGGGLVNKVVFDEARCKGCGLCMEFCPKGCIKMADQINAKGYHPAILADEDKCVSCGTCARMCPDAVIEVFKP